MVQEYGGVDLETIGTYVTLLAPFAPHLAEELWERLGHTDSVFHEAWPVADEELAADEVVEIPVQLNGKTKAVISVSVNAARDDVLEAGRKAVADRLAGMTVIKEILVPGKIINFVIRK